MAKKFFGTCKLTGAEDKLVKAHIIPQAFTRPSRSGSPLYQSSKGNGYRRRWTSWYDSTILSREGEDYFAKLDDLAVKALREAKLVWSGWHFPPHDIQSFAPMMPSHGIRTITLNQQEALCRFFWSVAWRASVSNIEDMRDFRLPIEIEEKVGTAIVEEAIDCQQFQVSLTKLSSKGEPHNQSPFLSEKEFGLMQSGEPRFVPIARLYMDGLIAHLHLTQMPTEDNSDIGIYLGESKKLGVSTITYEASFQYENTLRLAFESHFGPMGEAKFH